MNDPIELLAAMLASVGLFLAIVAGDAVVLPLTALTGLGLALGALDRRHRRRARSYHRLDAPSLSRDLSSP
ncbi:MAG TPA: hypothetical protein VFW92_10590 [Candidatus Limnocylindrales bacterium]|jgi:hypothetical protein|nr:hypothetical protein [Candidatus Limnocylindrales bacterium]